MAKNKVVSVVGRMPFCGITTVRPAALRGALAARRGDMETLGQCDRRIGEISEINRTYAVLGAVILGANAVYAVRNGSLAHCAEATFGGLVAAGHAASAYAQYCIRERLRSLVPDHAEEETPVDQMAEEDQGDYPSFYTPAPRFSCLVDTACVVGSIVGIAHPVVEFMANHTP
jgi:hypothetical protein